MSTPRPPSKKPGKRLLVASIGVATITYVSSQTGCALEHDDDPVTSGNLLSPPSVEPALRNDGGLRDGAADAEIFVSGNLVAPPYDRDATIVTSGNLLPPPDAATHRDAEVDASKDAGKPKDSGLDWDAFPPSGNLLPPPVQ